MGGKPGKTSPPILWDLGVHARWSGLKASAFPLTSLTCFLSVNTFAACRDVITGAQAEDASATMAREITSSLTWRLGLIPVWSTGTFISLVFASLPLLASSK